MWGFIDNMDFNILMFSLKGLGLWVVGGLVGGMCCDFVVGSCSGDVL